MGTPLPLGVSLQGDGANFAIFSRHATHVRLEFYDQPGDAAPVERIELTPERHRTGDVWHVWVQGIQPGQLYAYRMDGPYQPTEGHRFNSRKLLLDPYATAISHISAWDFRPAFGYDPAHPLKDLAPSDFDDAGAMPKCIFTHEHFDWEGDRPLRLPWIDLVIYETHVRGFTIHPSAGVTRPGTYTGLVEKIPYLQDLGITAVELLPVTEFNENELQRINPLTGERLRNYWGYNPVAFMAPHAGYASEPGRSVTVHPHLTQSPRQRGDAQKPPLDVGGIVGGERLRQNQQKFGFKEMVRACHRAGIEVILDVVLNHTAEGDELGPTLNLRGIDNDIYYMLADDKRSYLDYSGVGNTINANHPVVRDYLLDVLRYWVMEMHVDGFRFDLASVLGRDEHGVLLANAPLLERIAEDPILREVKLIAEAWDAAGAYQVGSFSERRWAEWNGRYRDDVRRFWRGDAGMLGAFAWRICGSEDLYRHSGKGPENSINFITCHDGFTLTDLVSYRHKHNEANGENNRDGLGENFSENYGIEGPTDDPEIEAVRVRQIKNLLLTLFISRGVPMLLGGDEFRRTQQGNNNAFCQDNEISWCDWRLLKKHREIHRFVRGMIALRRAHPLLRKEVFYRDEDIVWFDPAGNTPHWSEPTAKAVACLILGGDEPDLFLMFNAGTRSVRFILPPRPPGQCWTLAADTARPAPADLPESGQESILVSQGDYDLQERSSVILITHPTPSP